MSNVVVDGFGAYGVGDTTSQALTRALLAGAYANIPFNMGVSIAQGLAWNTSDPRYWFSGGAGNAQHNDCIRRALPAAQTTIFASMHVAVNMLPGFSNNNAPIRFMDADANVIGTLYIMPTGVVKFDYGNGSVSSSGPVVVAEASHHFEMELASGATKSFKLYVDDALVINSTGLNFAFTTDVALLGLVYVSVQETAVGPTVFLTDLIIRDTNGTTNNTIPIGDRSVATLMVNKDDVAHQGWTGYPLHRFGTGVLDLTPTSTSGVLGPISVASDLGAGDFTIEGQFRFQALPTNADKAVLFGKWEETHNLRSYELYLGGPSLEAGALVFRTSTDGTSGTVVEKATWGWQPDIGRWYHIAMCRDAGSLKLFIDGVLQGVAVADATTYFAGAARPGIGIEVDIETFAVVPVAGTHLQGWQDEFRLTVGLSRYSTNFAAPTAAFPRGGGDADWANVAWLSSWDTGSITDDGPLAQTLIVTSTPKAITTNDGDANYETINKRTPDDDTFIAASLVAATGTLTLTANPANTETVTLGTKDGTAAAVYTFKTVLAAAFDVLIGATQTDSVNNLIAAIVGGSGEGTLYGTGTTSNFNAFAELQPSGQLLATALTAGTAGNAVASTETLANGSWGAATLQGGLNIPAWSAFGFERLPKEAVLIDSVTFQTRQWKTNSGGAKTQMSFLGIGGGALAGTERSITQTPTLYYDLFEVDPDTASTLTPQSVISGEVKINRTV